MSATAKTLSDADIEQLAAYFSGLSDKQPPVRGKENMAGKSVSGACISCHGMWGKPVNSQWPVISGQKKGYLEKQLKDFRDGTRESPVMSVIVKGFTDQQIKDVAEYYSQFRRD
jgi:cytochrome c553